MDCLSLPCPFLLFIRSCTFPYAFPLLICGDCVGTAAIDTVQVLVTLGADLKSRDARGRTPLAAGRESPACGEELIALLRALTAGGGDEPAPAPP